MTEDDPRRVWGSYGERGRSWGGNSEKTAFEEGLKVFQKRILLFFLTDWEIGSAEQ